MLEEHIVRPSTITKVRQDFYPVYTSSLSIIFFPQDNIPTEKLIELGFDLTSGQACTNHAGEPQIMFEFGPDSKNPKYNPIEKIKINFDIWVWNDLEMYLSSGYDREAQKWYLTPDGEQYLKQYFSSLLPLEEGEQIIKVKAYMNQKHRGVSDRFSVFKLLTNKNMFVIDNDELHYEYVGHWCGLW